MSRLRNRWAWAWLALLCAVALWSATHAYDPTKDVHPAEASEAPSWAHWFGTDHLGRDVWTRSVAALRAFVGPAIVAAGVSVSTGVPLGTLAGVTSGGVEAALRLPAAVVAAVPRFVLVLLICSIFGSDPRWLGLAAGFAFAPGMAEAVFARIASLRQLDFVDALRAHGVPFSRIVWFHLLWVGCRRLVLRQLIDLVAFTLTLECTLAFLGGFGVEEPTPSWGNMIAFERSGLTSVGWATAVPVLLLWGTSVALAVAGRSLSQARGAR